MPSQFSTIGFNITSAEDLAALASRAAEDAERISTPRGEYLKWAPPSGEQLWLQITPEGDAMGMNAHFAGKSSVRVAVEAKVTRPSHTPLDGTFLAWANPSGDAASAGDYPFVFDCPDAATHLELPLPSTVTAQVAAFAQQVSLYESAAAYVSSQAAEGVSSPSRSFIPSGLMSPDGTPRDPPEPHALLAGHVLEAATSSELHQRVGLLVGARRNRGRHVRCRHRSQAAGPGSAYRKRPRGMVLVVGQVDDRRAAPECRIRLAAPLRALAFYGRFRKPLSAIHSSSRSAQRSTGRVVPARSPNPWPPVL